MSLRFQLRRFGHRFMDGFWTWILIAVLLIGLAVLGAALTNFITGARAATSLPWSCETVRQYADKFSDRQRRSIIRLLRLTPEQIAEAKKCLEKKP